MDETKTKFAAFKEFMLQHKKLAVLIVGLLFAGLAPLLFSFSPAKPPEQQDYSSQSLGFSVSLPAGWTVKEEDVKSGPDILIMDTKSPAFVRIRGFVDPNVDSPEAIQSSIVEYQKTFAMQTGVSLSDFQTEEIKNNIGGFSASGEFPVKDVTYRFFERGWLSMAGQVLILRAADAPESFDESLPVMKKIMDSFKLD